MRYYAIRIYDADNKTYVPDVNGRPGFSKVAPYGATVSTGGLVTYSSLYQSATLQTIGGTNPAALTVEIDIPVTFFHNPGANGYVRLHNIGLAEIAQASNLTGAFIEIYGGMAKGLPLANPAQSGLLARGQIAQAFGNWLGLDQTLDIFIVASGSNTNASETTGVPGSTLAPATNANPGGIIWNWQPGQTMQSAIVTTLSTAFPNYSLQGSIYSDLVLTGAPEVGYFAALKQFSEYLNQKSRSIVLGYAPPLSSYPSNTNYYGVALSLSNNVFTIQDGTSALKAKAIAVTDLIGQPTYSEPYQIQITCVMRADIDAGDYITLPQTPGLTNFSASNNFSTANTYAQIKQGIAFSGTYMVTAVRHVGNSRYPDAGGWVTTLDCLAVAPTDSAIQSSGTTGAAQLTKWPTLYTNN